jgi:hypothetical protein
MNITAIDNVIDIISNDTNNMGLRVMTEFRDNENILMLYTKCNGHDRLIGQIKRKDKDSVVFEPITSILDKQCSNCKWSSIKLSKGLYDKETGIDLLNCLHINNQPNIKTAASVIVLSTSWCKNWKEKQ